MARDIVIDPGDLSSEVAAQLRKHRAQLLEAAASGEGESVIRFALHVRTDEGEEHVDLPPGLTPVFAVVLVEVAEGHAVHLGSVEDEMTTGEAANLLNVSRPHLVKLLEAGELPYRKVGTHRRVRRTDVLAYREAERLRAEKALQELADEAQELGLGYM